MPRISRTAVEFDADGATWIAEFVHQHAERKPDGKLVPILFQLKDGQDKGRFIKLQHLTLCKLRYKGANIFLTGAAPCSMKDRYKWQKGIHYSLQRALEKGGYCKLEKVTECPHPAGPSTAAKIHMTADCPAIGKVVVKDRTPTYTAVMRRFWEEMQIPAPKPPQAPPTTSIPAEVILPPAEQLLSPGVISRAYSGMQHGMGWTGD